MALTTVERVRELMGIDDEDAPFLFRLHNELDPEAALEARIQRDIDVMSAWLRLRAPDDYDSGDPDTDTMFAEAEAWLTIRQLSETLKQRKVAGTHTPYDMEDSDRWQALIDVEIPAHIQQFIDGFLVVDTPGGDTWSAPAVAFSGPVDRSQVQTVESDYDDIIADSLGIKRPEPRFPM